MKLLYPHKDLEPLKIKWKIKECPQRFFSKSQPRPEGTEHFLFSVIQNILDCLLPIKCLVNTQILRRKTTWGPVDFVLKIVVQNSVFYVLPVSHLEPCQSVFLNSWRESTNPNLLSVDLTPGCLFWVLLSKQQ